MPSTRALGVGVGMQGFCVLSDFAEIESWNDPALGIDWPVTEPILCVKDESAQSGAEWLARREAANFRYGHYRAGGVAS